MGSFDIRLHLVSRYLCLGLNFQNIYRDTNLAKELYSLIKLLQAYILGTLSDAACACSVKARRRSYPYHNLDVPNLHALLPSSEARYLANDSKQAVRSI